MSNKAVWDAAFSAFTDITPSGFTSLANNTLSAVSSKWDNTGAAAGTYNTTKQLYFYLDIKLVFNGTPTANLPVIIFANKSIDGGASNFATAPTTGNMQYFLDQFVTQIPAQASAAYTVEKILGPFDGDPTVYQFYADNRSGVALNTGSFIKILANDMNLNG